MELGPAMMGPGMGPCGGGGGERVGGGGDGRGGDGATRSYRRMNFHSISLFREDSCTITGCVLQLPAARILEQVSGLEAATISKPSLLEPRNIHVCALVELEVSWNLLRNNPVPYGVVSQVRLYPGSP